MKNIITKVYEELRTDSAKAAFAGLMLGWEHLGDVRNDAPGMVYAARQLEHVFDEAYEEDFPDLPVANGEIMPIDTSVHEGAKTWTYYLYSGTAVARYGADFSDGTLPRVTRTGAQVTAQIHTIENEYGYSTADMRAAAMAKDPLEASLATLARRGHDQTFHRGGLWGRAELGFNGLLNHPNITIVTSPQSLETADVDEIVEIFGSLIESTPQITRGLRQATRVLMSRRVRALLMRRRLGPGDGTISVLDYLKKTWDGSDGGVRIEFGLLEELDWRVAQTEADAGVPNVDIDSTTGDCLVAYVHDNPKVLRLIQPMPFKQYPIQFRGLTYTVPCESSIGGVRLPEPTTVTRMEGVYF